MIGRNPTSLSLAFLIQEMGSAGLRMGGRPRLQEPHLNPGDDFSLLCARPSRELSRTQRPASWSCWQPRQPPRAIWRDLLTEQRVFPFALVGIRELPRSLIPVQKYARNVPKALPQPWSKDWHFQETSFVPGLGDCRSSGWRAEGAGLGSHGQARVPHTRCGCESDSGVGSGALTTTRLGSG